MWEDLQAGNLGLHQPAVHMLHDLGELLDVEPRCWHLQTKLLYGAVTWPRCTHFSLLGTSSLTFRYFASRGRNLPLSSEDSCLQIMEPFALPLLTKVPRSLYVPTGYTEPSPSVILGSTTKARLPWLQKECIWKRIFQSFLGYCWDHPWNLNLAWRLFSILLLALPYLFPQGVL